jgi:hypothetical protein
MVTLDEMNQAVIQGKTKMLTLDRITGLTGKRIATFFFDFRPPYRHEADEFVVGKIISAFDLHPDQKSVVEEFKESPHLLNRLKSTMKIITEEGQRTNIQVEPFKSEIFTAPDNDFLVWFKEL